MTRNRLWRDALIVLAFAFVLLAYVFASEATAQVAQPQYVRPSKGTPINVFPGPEGRGLPANTPQTASAVFDFSAFDAAQIAISFRDAGGTSCAGGFATWNVSVYGGPDRVVPNPLIALSLPDPNAIKTEASFPGQDQIYEVGYLPTYIALYATTGALVPGTPTSCRILVTMIPKPFANPARTFGDVTIGAPVPSFFTRPTLIGGEDYSPTVFTGKVQVLRVDSQGRITTANGAPLFIASNFERGVKTVTNVAGGVTVVAGNPASPYTYYTAHLQNLGVHPVACVIGPVGATSVQNNCVMKAATGAATYDGGECDLPGIRMEDRIQCASLGAGNSAITIFQAVYSQK